MSERPSQMSSMPGAPRDWTRLLARVLCTVFAVLGALPIIAGFAIKSDWAHRWVTEESRRLLREQLAVDAQYDIDVRLWPLRVDVENVSIPGNDGKGAAVEIDRVAVAPRVFALMAGTLDVGDVEIEGARQRLVIEGGKVTNLDLQLPESPKKASRTSAPFSSLSLTDATFELLLDGVAMDVRGVDLDVFPEETGSYEVALRVGESRVQVPESLYPEPKDGPRGAWDGDVLCQLDVRVRIEDGSVLVRRLSLIGSVDIDPNPDTAAGCAKTEEDPPNRVAVRAHQLRVTPGNRGAPWLVQGETMLRVPLELGNRIAPDVGPFSGWVGLNGALRYDGSTRLPQFQGKIKLSELGLGDHTLMQGAEGVVEVRQDKLLVPEITIQYGSGNVVGTDVMVAPFEPGAPFLVKNSKVTNVLFPKLISNLGITDDTIVYFVIDSATVIDFGGTLSPLKLDGQMSADVSDFEIFRGSYRSPTRTRMLGLNSKGSTRGTFSVREDSVHFTNQQVRFGKSSLHTSVVVGIEDGIKIETWDSKIDLADVSPLVTVPMKGVLHLDTKMEGSRSDPLLISNISVDDLEFGGFPVGSLDHAVLTFRPLWIELDDALLKTGQSRISMPKVRFDFDGGADLEIDAQVHSEHMKIVDFMRMWRFDEDPLWRDVSGQSGIRAKVHYVLGGEKDRCGDGMLRVNAGLDMDAVSLFGESFDGGTAELDLVWADREASYHGLTLDVPTFQLRKGTGSLLGNFDVSPGAKVRGNVVMTAVPLARFDALSGLKNLATGSVSGIVQVGGSLDAMNAEAQVDVSPIKIGRSQLPPSNLHVSLEPMPGQVRFEEGKKSGCGRAIPAADDTAAADKSGTFHISGSLLGGQLTFDDFDVTRETHKVASGRVVLKDLDIGSLTELSPAVAFSKDRPTGKVSASVDIETWPLDALGSARATAKVDALGLSWRGFSVRVDNKPTLTLAGDRASVDTLILSLSSTDAEPTILEVQGAVNQLGGQPTLDVNVGVKPVALSGLAHLLPSARRVQGTLEGKLRLSGPVGKPLYAGGFTVRDGLIEMRGTPLALSELEVDLKLDNAGLNIEKATARVGTGSVSATGLVPLNGLTPESFRGKLDATDISWPIARGVDVTLDAELETIWDPKDENQEDQPLPRVTGEVSIKSFEYSRAVTMNADISSLTGRPKRTEFESYDPDKDAVELDVLVTSKGPFRLNNNLIEANLDLEPPGLRLTGTNQRFGLKGNMKVVPGGRIRLRRNDFEIQAGEVQFDDSTRIAPRVDVTAVTEYRRYASTTSTGTSGAPTTASSATAASGSTSGQWRINMHAYGDAENLKLDLTSQPKLSQDDIFLLLTVGLTRAELDQAQSASLGESVALEALGSLTGADSAVSNAIPAIDEFRFGSAYSARTGRTEPTVTVGKRLSERIRAYVTSGISESREVRSNLEWRLKPGVSVEGSYDNVNDVSSSSLGNLGADVRWRLEFE